VASAAWVALSTCDKPHGLHPTLEKIPGAILELMREIWLTVGLLFLSNVFMTFAWHAHLQEMSHRPLGSRRPVMYKHVYTLKGQS
jgi:hypothetical protein